MAIVQKITPCLWFDNQAEEAAKFYQIRTRHESDDADEEAGPAGAATRP
jgi:predicted 3-demethylubiquinone-9 3-methyltransferase (glyoxalase superfamily)